MNSLCRLIEMCEANGLLIPVLFNNVVDRFKYGPVGELLAENVRKEWLYSNVTNRDENVFLHHPGGHGSDSLLSGEAFEVARSLNGGHVPFGLAETRTAVCVLDALAADTATPEEAKYFRPRHSNTMRYVSFASPADSQQFFYRWQRHRNMWWRKFSVDPGRFSLSEGELDAAGGERAHIKVQWPWGEQVVETIVSHADKPFQQLDATARARYEVRDGRKKCLPHLVESTCSLECAVVTFLSDAFIPPAQFRFHRKLAPFKIAFAAALTNAETAAELRQLCTYLAGGLRKGGISCLLPPATELGKKSLDSQLCRADALGTAFTAVLSQETLTNGLLALRSRDTTLQEKIHVGKLVGHVELLMKNC